MKNLFAVLVVLSAVSNAGETGIALYRGPLNFQPLEANTFEPRVGVIWHANGNRLRLDIGNSIDLIQYRHASDGALWTVGTDFFTYTLLRGEKNFHFPVDAVDYFFGVNLNYRDTLGSGILTSRIRLSHISAHFVDGHFDGTSGMWKDGLNPRVYSREFFDLTLSFEPTHTVRCYAGGTYLWHVDPTTITPMIGYAGGELHRTVSPSIHLFSAYQITVTGQRPRHEIILGSKIGVWRGRGTQIFFAYHYGNSIHGEYFDRKDEYSGLGFNIDI